jgi:hypothetical protein
MPRLAKGTLLLALACGASACQTDGLPRPRAQAEQVQLIRYGVSTRTLGDGELERQYRALVLESGSSPSSENAIKLALLLSRPETSVQDPDQALRLLNGASEPRAGNDNADFAKLMYYLLSERNCVAPQSAPLADMLLEERDRSKRLGNELADTKAALEAERELRQTLQGQLDALKALEERLKADELEK